MARHAPTGRASTCTVHPRSSEGARRGGLGATGLIPERVKLLPDVRSRKVRMASPGESIVVVGFAIRRRAARQSAARRHLWPLVGVQGQRRQRHSCARGVRRGNETEGPGKSASYPPEPRAPRPRGASPQCRRGRVNYWGKDIILPQAGSAAALNCGAPGQITRRAAPHGNLA